MMSLPLGFDIIQYVSNHMVLGIALITISTLLFIIGLMLKLISKVRTAL